MAYQVLGSDQLRRSYASDKPVAQTAASSADAAHPPPRNKKGADTDLHQPRATQALLFGMNIDGPGYNVYALGSPRSGMTEFVLSTLGDVARHQPASSDLCYVANLEKPSEPVPLILPAGLGRRVREDITNLLSNLATTIQSNFSSDEFRNRMNEILDTYRQRQEQDQEELRKEALGMNLAMLPTPNGFAFAPQKDGSVLSSDDIEKISDEERETYAKSVEKLSEKLRSRLIEYPALQQEILRKQRSFAEASAKNILSTLTSQLRSRYQAHSTVIAHIDAISDHLLRNIQTLLALGAHDNGTAFESGILPDQLKTYEVNLLLDRTVEDHAPVVYESNPSIENLVGKLEHRIEFGMPVSDYSLIRPGALHKANGGYLVLDIERVLNKPYAWEALKRALGDGFIRIESVNQLLGMSYSVSLDPGPVPLSVKVILLGPRWIYHILRQHDSDFDAQFKVLADFADEVDWTDANQLAYEDELQQFTKRANLKPLSPEALGRVLEHGSRLVADQERLTAHTEELFDLVREADSFANTDKSEQIHQSHVNDAIAARIYRVDRVKDLVLRHIERGQTVVSTQGRCVGQVNGLSVMQLGKLVFGQPSRITATARIGRGEVIDIERESKLGGNIHSKAVMIVANFIGYQYAREQPLSLHASLVFEQSYGGIEGDSASVAEVCALLSAITDMPLRQDIAITGSMDQHGTVQAIGGVNEKIEGFFEVCNSSELTGTQGVLIPASNADNLMLRHEVIEAVERGAFQIVTMTRIEDALAVMFGEHGSPMNINSIEDTIKQRLKHFYQLWQKAQRSGQQNNDFDSGGEDDEAN